MSTVRTVIVSGVRVVPAGMPFEQYHEPGTEVIVLDFQPSGPDTQYRYLLVTRDYTATGDN